VSCIRVKRVSGRGQTSGAVLLVASKEVLGGRASRARIYLSGGG
jgi:hypothetical protein